MGAYKDKNGTWYAQFRFTNWKGEPDRKTKRGFATKKEALDWERDFLTQSAGNLEMTFEAFYELYKKNLQDRLKKSTWKMKTSVIESKILPYFKKKRMCDIKPRDIVAWQNVILKECDADGNLYSPVYLKTMLLSFRTSPLIQTSARLFGPVWATRFFCASPCSKPVLWQNPSSRHIKDGGDSLWLMCPYPKT